MQEKQDKQALESRCDVQNQILTGGAEVENASVPVRLSLRYVAPRPTLTAIVEVSRARPSGAGAL
jgi:hypothetical protein